MVAYGQIIPEEILSLTKKGFINIHASLLPKWRGATPIQSSILNGDIETGVSIIRMIENLDAGPIFISKKVQIRRDENHYNLSKRLSLISAEMINKHLESIIEGKIHPIAQQDREASFCNKIIKSDGEINWSNSAIEIDRIVKAFNPWPIAYTYADKKYLRVWDSAAELESSLPGVCGEVIDEKQDGVLVKTGKGSLLIKSLQLEGKKKMPAIEFTKGFSLMGKTLGLKI